MTDTWTWATVTQASPLRIKVDGDTSALNATTDDLVGSLAVDDRVRVHLHADGIIVTGLQGGGVPWLPAILGKTSVQDIGGAAGTDTNYNWETETLIPIGFTRESWASGRLYVDVAGWYEIDFIANAETEGGYRTTLMGRYRLDSGANKYGGTIRGYTRGSGYGNLTFGLRTIAYITAGQYLQMGSVVEYTDGTYVINTSGTEVGAEETRLIVRRVA